MNLFMIKNNIFFLYLLLFLTFTMKIILSVYLSFACFLLQAQYRTVPVNPNQHTVHKSDGSTYKRTNPNSTREDNLIPYRDNHNRHKNKGPGAFSIILIISLVIFLISKGFKKMEKEIVEREKKATDFFSWSFGQQISLILFILIVMILFIQIGK